jgi:alcohol dehydrogenase class IV
VADAGFGTSLGRADHGVARDLAASARRRRHGYHRQGRALQGAAGPDDAEAREALSTAALLSGLALANAGLGAVHGIAAPLCGGYPVSHGAACAALLPSVTAANIRALRQRDLRGPALPRYARAAELLLGRRAGTEDTLLDDLVAALRELVDELGIPRLASYGLAAADVPALAAQAAQASSSRGNPIDLEQGELAEAILAAR